MATTASAASTTDPSGTFLLEGIDPGVAVSLEARAGIARTEGPQSVGAGATGPVTLSISGANSVALSGRVIDSAGKPLTGVLVRIRARKSAREPFPEPDAFRFTDTREIRTGLDGRYTTPREIRRGSAYRAEVSQAKDVMADVSPWLELGPTNEPQVPVLTLQRLATLEGRVLDSQGQPVAGALAQVVGEAPADDGVVEPGMVVTIAFDGDEDDTLTFLLASREYASADIETYSPRT